MQSLPKDQVFCKLTEKSMELHVKDLDNKDYLLVINKLLDSINVEESYWKQKTGKNENTCLRFIFKLNMIMLCIYYKLK